MKHFVKKHVVGMTYLAEAYMAFLKAFILRHPFSFTKMALCIMAITITVCAILLTYNHIQSEREFRKSMYELSQRSLQLERSIQLHQKQKEQTFL